VLLASDEDGWTVFHVAAIFSKVELLQGLLKWAKKNLTKEEANKLLLASGNKRKAVFPMAPVLLDLALSQEY
jgi:hypothetical protein